MNYIDVYKRRISHLGKTPQQRAYQSGILEFRRFLKYSQETEHCLKKEGDISYFSGVIQTDKEDENRVSQILLVKVVEDGGPTLKQGDLIWWGKDKQPWLIYQTTTSSYQPHQKFYMVRCNYEIKWVDGNGLLKKSWVYLLGTKDSKIQDNFRNWHSVVTPQPNKYIELMMPHQQMALGTEIIVLDEAWSLVDYDQNSVPGIIYLSFTETNLNEQRDDVEDKIANKDQIATWEIDMTASRIVAANSIFELSYAILKNGVAQEVAATVELDGNLTLLENNQIQVGSSGGGTITVSYLGVSKTQAVVVGGTPAVKLNFIGDSKIRVASTNSYILENATSNVEFELDDPNELVSIKVEGNKCEVIANSKNKLGTFTLAATCEGQQFVKTITVVSLWQVI